MRSIFTILLFLIISMNSFCEQDSITYAFGAGDWIPIIYEDTDSNIGYNGLYVEILEEIFTNRLDMNLNYEVFPWKRTQKRVEQGKADFLVTVATDERLKYTEKSVKPLFQLYMHIYTYKDHKRLKEIQSIESPTDILERDFIPVSNLGNGWHKENIDSFGIPTMYVKEDTSIVLMLAAKRADIMIEPAIPMNNEIKKLGLTNKLILTDVKFGPVDFYLLMSNKSNYLNLMPEINRVILEMLEDGTLDRLTSKYMALE